jgi:hypothetical protein
MTLRTRVRARGAAILFMVDLLKLGRLGFREKGAAAKITNFISILKGPLQI